jgi:hypothetical protein
VSSDRLIFFDCFSKQAHLGRPGRANPLDPSRVSEQQLRKARDELETKVAERTAELQRSEAYLAEAQRLSHTGSLGWDQRETLLVGGNFSHL